MVTTSTATYQAISLSKSLEEAVNDAVYYYSTTKTFTGTSTLAPHPFIAVLDKDYQQIQHILDNKGSVVL